jgi:hypothetical protein|tara:strand:+ start:369 stop:626 length:258 start_codon:yes stop_codon:yes gene_type:complete
MTDINGLKLEESDGGYYYYPIIEGEIYEKILLKDCREIYSDRDTFEIIVSTSDRELVVFPSHTNTLKWYVEREYNRIEDFEVDDG